MDEMLMLLFLALLAPFLGAILSALFRGRIAYGIAVLAAVVPLAASIAAALSIYMEGGMVYTIPGFGLPWLEMAGGTYDTGIFGIVLDNLSAIALLAVAVLGFLVVIYATEYIEKRYELDPSYDGRRSYIFWLLIFIGSLVGLVLSPSLLAMFIFWEMNGYSMWALIANNPKDKALNAGFRALIMTHIGGLAFLVAILLTFIQAHSFAYSAIGQLTPAFKVAVVLLLMVAAWAKCAQVPFHRWLPDAIETPTILSSYLPVAAMLKPGVFLIARIMISGFALPDSAGLIMAIMAMITMFMAVLSYFRQDDLYRIMGYSAIIGLAYIFVGFSLGIAGSRAGYEGAILYMFCDAAAKGTLFLAVGAVAYGAGSTRISELQGLARKMPLEGFAYLIGLLAATGVPPFAGFWPKFYIFIGTLEAPTGWLMLILLATESVVSFGWLLWIGQKIFLGRPSELVEAAGDPPPGMSMALILGMVLCLLMPLLGIPLMQGLMP